MRKNKNKYKLLPWYVIIAILVLLYFFAAFTNWWHVDANEMFDPHVSTINGFVPMPTEPPLPPLPAEAEELIRWAWKDKGEKVIKEALLVARCESGLKPTAANTKNNRDKSRDDGLFQINSKAHGIPVRFLHDPRVNVMVARHLYDTSGWGPWYSSRKCHGLH